MSHSPTWKSIRAGRCVLHPEIPFFPTDFHVTLNKMFPFQFFFFTLKTKIN